MFQYLVWIGIYFLSIKFMTKFAGRNSPLWGMIFVLVSFFIIPISTIVAMVFISIFPFLSNTLVIILLSLFLNFLITLFFAFILALFLKKKDIRKRTKRTKINYKIVTILIIILGISMLFLNFLIEKKLNTWLMVLIAIMVAQSIGFYKQTKLQVNLTIDELDNKDFILFLRSFNSVSLSSTPTKPIKIYEWWKLRLTSKNLTLQETLERTSLPIDEYISKIISKNNPLIAFGNPEDYLPTFGSIKVYSDDKFWQDSIIKYITKSKKILILEGFSEGLLWELEYIKQNIEPSKVLILTYPQNFRNTKAYQKNISYVEFSSELNNIGYKIPRADIGGGVILTFDKNWNAKIEGQGTKFLSEYLKTPIGEIL